MLHTIGLVILGGVGVIFLFAAVGIGILSGVRGQIEDDWDEWG